MGETDGLHQRRVFRWPKEATELVREYKERTNRSQELNEIGRRKLVTTLAEISGNPRDACLRFLREFGIHQKRGYREWTKPEQQRLPHLISSLPVEEVANILRRPAGSVRSMLHRLGMGGKTGREWFTKFSLSLALHTRPDEIQKWIDRGWLKSRSVSNAGTKASGQILRLRAVGTPIERRVNLRRIWKFCGMCQPRTELSFPDLAKPSRFRQLPDDLGKVRGLHSLVKWSVYRMLEW